jgi:DMSO/TMAO reductase YedYZ molybdopterin-dependent catalytic subunit
VNRARRDCEHGCVRSRSLLGALIGVLCAAVAVGVGEAVAAFVRPAAAPVIAVANRVILLTPESAKRSAINSFGTDDKTVLIVLVYVLLALFGALVGQLALRRLTYGLIGIAVFAAFGVYCALTANASQASDVIPTLVGGAVAAGVLVVLVRVVQREDTDHSRAEPRLAERRRFLQAGAAAAGLAAVAGLGGRAVQHARFDVEAERAKVTLPPPVEPAPGVPTGADLGKSGVPWQTPDGAFYRIDTAIDVPQVSPDDWSLRIHGMVDRELKLTFAELKQRPMIERWITLCCVSNPVGGPLISNALWLGTKLADLLREVGLHAGSDQLLLTSVDGYTFGAPTKVVLDGRDALLAIGMNGQPLPVEHGFPVRVVVPGLYGYVSACKWVVDIEATTFAAESGYWVQGGWASGAAQPDIKLESRIDTPRSGARVRSGQPVPVAGVAWDQHVGVSAVHVQVDDGAWLPARLAAVPSTDTWRQWVVTWTPPRPGSYVVRVRASDAAGKPQTLQRADTFPSGATGLHTITVHAS